MFMWSREAFGIARQTFPLIGAAARRKALVSAVALTATAAAIAACGPGPEPVWHGESGYRWRELRPSGSRAGFTRMRPARTGISFENTVSESALVANRMLGQGAGVALGDVDGDGRTDVFLARTEGCSALYRNQGDWTFEEITATAGVGACSRHATGAVLADTDGDDDLDLVLLATAGPNAVFVNDGAARFTEHFDLGLDSAGRGGTTIAMADVDGSGRLALYVANYKAYNVDDRVPPQQRAFNQVVTQVAKDQYAVVPSFQRDYKLVVRPDMGGLRLTQRAAPDEFYTNDGRGRFTKVAVTSGRFLDASGRRIAEDFESFTLGARFADLNADGAPDLYVANDFEDPDQLWFNDGRGNFRLADWTSQRQISNSTMGVDVGDVNGDGLPDLFCVDMLANDTRRLRTQIPTNTGFPKKPGDFATQLQHQRNTLFLNRGDGTFAEIAQHAGVAASGWSWGTLFMDADLDGRQDILVANGHLYDVMDADVQEALQTRLTGVDWRRLAWQFPRLALRNVAFRNRGDLTFEDVSEAWGFGTEDDVSHALASADLDGDGDLDVVVNRLGSPALLLRNDSPNARVAVRLKGAVPNTRAVGAVIRLEGGAIPVQIREIAVGGLYMSHSDYLVSFAMGAADSASLVVTWRDGRTSSLQVRANRLYEVSESGNSPRTPSSPTGPASGRAATTVESPLFTDATAELAGHHHTENAFDDWGRQFLLPSAISPLGPGLAWFDVDRDGAEDLVVGAGNGGRISVFRSVAGRLTASRATFPLATASLTAVLGLADAAGSRILAGASTWQARADSEMVNQPAVLSFALRDGVPAPVAAGAVGSHASATGPLALGDYDGDGSPDLFVGSRAIPLRYPLAPSSGLFRNVNGRFVHDAAGSEVLDKVGMVSAAMFADVNGDGHADLVLAREWDSILLLLNDGKGRLQSAPNGWDLGQWKSRWNGVTAGDLDGDGRLDLVATSWGRNNSFGADAARPLILLHGPIGAAGEEEMIVARHDARIGGLGPMTSYARARVAIPDLVRAVGTFAAWADAPIESSMRALVPRLSRLTATTFDQMVFFNRGDRFEARALPTEAQLAPAFYAGVADFDGNGTEDVFLGQNFSFTPIGLSRDDAGRGLLLNNDGLGNLSAVDGEQSGIKIYGDQRGAGYADYNGDGRLDLGVSQNAGATRLYRNRGAKPGLRVRVRGPATNPDGIGAQLRIVFGDRMGPLREVQAGSGYWSQNGAVQVFGTAAPPAAVWIRWPGGVEARHPVPPGAREIEISSPRR